MEYSAPCQSWIKSHLVLFWLRCHCHCHWVKAGRAPDMLPVQPRADTPRKTSTHVPAHEQLFRTAIQPYLHIFGAVAGSSPQRQTQRVISVFFFVRLRLQHQAGDSTEVSERGRRHNWSRLKHVVRLNSFTATFCYVSNRDGKHCC